MSTPLGRKLHLKPRKGAESLWFTIKNSACGRGVPGTGQCRPSDSKTLLSRGSTNPYYLIAGRPSTRRKQVSLEFDKDVATFRHQRGINCIELVTESTLNSLSQGTNSRQTMMTEEMRMVHQWFRIQRQTSCHGRKASSSSRKPWKVLDISFETKMDHEVQGY